MQKILTLIIAVSILYMVYKEKIEVVTPANEPKKIEKKQTKEDQELELSGSVFERTLSTLMINILKTEQGRIFFENMISPVKSDPYFSGKGFEISGNNYINSLFNIITFGEGKIGPAMCGHLVSVHYKIFDQNNFPIKEGDETYSLGQEKIGPGVDAIIVGMNIGQRRSATISSNYLINHKNGTPKNFKVHILLKDISPRIFINNKSEVKVFDDQIAYALPLLCANKVSFDFKIIELKNSKTIYDSTKKDGPLNMKIGNANYPIIFSYALHNKIPVGTRTVITKGKFFQTLLTKKSLIFTNENFTEEDYYMIDFYNLKTDNTHVNQ